jgi:hypothetical protein
MLRYAHPVNPKPDKPFTSIQGRRIHRALLTSSVTEHAKMKHIDCIRGLLVAAFDLIVGSARGEQQRSILSFKRLEPMAPPP